MLVSPRGNILWYVEKLKVLYCIVTTFHYRCILILIIQTKNDTIASLEIFHSFKKWMPKWLYLHYVVGWCLGWKLSKILRLNDNQISRTSMKNINKLYNLEVYTWIITWTYRDKTMGFSHISLLIEHCCLLNR